MHGKRLPAAPTSTCGAGSNTPKVSSGSDEALPASVRNAPVHPYMEEKAGGRPLGGGPTACRARLSIFARGEAPSARCGGGGGRPRVAERDPRVRVGLGLPFHETVAGF